MTKLVVVLILSGPLKGHKYFVKSDSKILIGRSEEANIRIAYDDFCSRRHALIYWVGDSCYVEDLNSKNGTFLNNKKIQGKEKITKGDTIGLGETELLIGIEGYPKDKSRPLGDDVSYED